ncbi:MAG: beta-lactamase family protein [Desulfobacteraceae bacterium]|nr:beta-lactamase family protein [Desulfobacteraceae bacterium]
MKLKIIFIYFLLICTALSCSDSDFKNSSEIFNNELDNILKRTFDSATVPGTSMMIKFKDGSVWKKSAGFAFTGSSSEDGVPMNTEMQFRIGSTTKTMIGTAVLILADQKKLNLSDNVEKILPGVIKYGNSITIESLLNHTSRLINYTNLEEFADIYLDNPTYPWTRNEIVDLFKDSPLIDFQAENESFYSNSNYYLLGMIIEKVSGMTLQNFMETFIFKPLKMNDTYIPASNFLTGNFADGYIDLNVNGYFEPEEKITSQNPDAIWSAGSAVSTLLDLSIWLDELMNGNLISSELQKKRMDFNCHVYGAPEEVLYSLGLMNQFGQIGHTGAVAGYTTIMFNYKGNSIIAFTNGYYLSPEEPDVPGLLLEAVVEMIDKD